MSKDEEYDKYFKKSYFKKVQIEQECIFVAISQFEEEKDNKYLK